MTKFYALDLGLEEETDGFEPSERNTEPTEHIHEFEAESDSIQ